SRSWNYTAAPSVPTVTVPEPAPSSSSACPPMVSRMARINRVHRGLEPPLRRRLPVTGLCAERCQHSSGAREVAEDAPRIHLSCSGILMPEHIEKSLREVDSPGLPRRPFTPSPVAWEDQVLYFLLLDRFSDSREAGGYRDNENRPVHTGSTPPYRPEDSGRVDYDTWFRAGGGWQGGTLKGLRGKLGYLRRLGVTALWVSRVCRQVAFEPSSHGSGIQNFLDVDPHFGTREEFRELVRAAHEQGIYVILDVIAHHTGNVFAYAPDRYPTYDPGSGREFNDPRWHGQPYPVSGFNDREGKPTLPFDQPDPGRMESSWPDGAIWPREFQRPGLFLRKGHISNWDYDREYSEGDMFDLKTLDIWVQWAGQYREASSALACLGLVYCFWIAYADLDGFRIDAAKHMGAEALRA